MESQGDFENLETLKELRTPRRIIFTKKINEVLEELRRVSPDEDLLMKKKEFIVQHYQQIKEYNRKIEIEIIRTEEHDEKAVLKELESSTHYEEMYIDVLVEINKVLEAKTEEKGQCRKPEILQVWQRTPEVGYGRDDEQEVEQGKGDRLKALMGFLRAEIYKINKSNKATASQLYVSKNKEYKYPKGSFSTTSYERKTKCIFCDGMGHENWKCFKIGRMTREEQLKKMSGAGVCFKCLKRNHLRRDCRTKIICQNCRGPHYLNFCRRNNSRRNSISEDGGSSKERKNNSSVQNQQSTVLLAQSCASEVLSMTVRAKICSSEASKVINVLLDSGSQYSFIKESLAKELGLEKLGERKLTKCLFGGRQTREEKHSLYSFSITNILKEETVQILHAIEDIILVTRANSTLALHALPHPNHPASTSSSCQGCGSVDRSLNHRYWSCRHIRPLIIDAFSVLRRPPDFWVWIFGSDLEEDDLDILASAKSIIYWYFVQVGLTGGTEDPLIAWERRLTRRGTSSA
ncbi:hypothetical protein LAZ67_12002219 [Cordylochernes scorpioides]|uniref:CCHC-type domain-containing protein n=1 Tax=Cordylochernes scorpioides TaxID=51811 RepID=A0ABY6L1L3_9ARAC|nr:hypothetical protein LAZ67_12002219 [Cordylochernes scorpioides]